MMTPVSPCANHSPGLGYLRDLYQEPDVANTVNFDHIRRGYYCGYDGINPNRIFPVGPLQDLTAPHHRERLG